MSSSGGSLIFSEQFRSRLGLILALIFCLVGILFLIIPGGVLGFFNSLSNVVGLPPSPAEPGAVFHALAVGYMYMVTLLAWSMFRQPGSSVFPYLLAHAKLASGIISLLLFAVHELYLVNLANGVIDCSIGIGVLFIYRQTTT